MKYLEIKTRRKAKVGDIMIEDRIKTGVNRNFVAIITKDGYISVEVGSRGCGVFVCDSSTISSLPIKKYEKELEYYDIVRKSPK